MGAPKRPPCLSKRTRSATPEDMNRLFIAAMAAGLIMLIAVFLWLVFAREPRQSAVFHFPAFSYSNRNWSTAPVFT
jgi:hypothetical protein